MAGTHGGPHRYGYRVDFSGIKPDEAAIIQELARRTLTGESLASLCRELNIRGIPTAAGGRWSPATLRRILIGPHLAGLRVYGEQFYPAAWPAILSEETHHALRALLTDPQRKTNPMRPTRHLWSGFLVCGHCGMRMYAYYRQAKSGPVKTLRCHRKLGGCGRLARSAEPIETFLETAMFEMVRQPAFTHFLSRRSSVPEERGALLNQIRPVEALQQENLVAYAAPEPGARRRTKAEYELIAARLDGQLDLLNKRVRALSTPELPDAPTDGDLEQEWPAPLLRSATHRGNTHCAGHTVSHRSRLSPVHHFIGADRLDVRLTSHISTIDLCVTIGACQVRLRGS